MVYERWMEMGFTDLPHTHTHTHKKKKKKTSGKNKSHQMK
jgi:hypothetical protein